VLDEAGHIAPVRNLPELAATGAEPGLQLVSVFHDAAQIQAAYGNQAPTVVSNHRARLYLPGIGIAETLIQLSTSLGDVEVTRQHTSDGPTGRTTTETITQRPPHDRRRPAPGARRRGAACLRHNRDRDLRRLAKGRT
jgi:type IV secretion system protein VirD4